MNSFGVSLSHVILNITKKFQVSRNSVITVIENLLTKITKERLGGLIDVVVKINKLTLTYKTYRLWVVVNDINLHYPLIEITYNAAKLTNKCINIGEKVAEVIDSIPFDTFVLKNIKSIIFKKLKEADKYTKLENYVNKINSIIVGFVKKINDFGFIVYFDDTISGFLPITELLPGENFNLNDKIKVCLISVNALGKGSKLLLSRIHDSLLLHMFCKEVPEISDGSIKIKALARIPGIRSKVAVMSYFLNTDPIGACLGIHATRLKAISEELNNENIDIVLWSDNFIDFIVNIFTPIPILTILVNENIHVIEIIIKKENLAKFIGRNGQNINLASVLIGWEINVINLFNDVNFFNIVHFVRKNVLELLKLLKKEKLFFSDVTILQLILSGYKTINEIYCIPDKELLEIFGVSKVELCQFRNNKIKMVSYV